MLEEKIKEFLELIKKFVLQVKKFESCLIHEFNLEGNPYDFSGKNFPKKGTFIFEENIVSYWFHGAGCTFEYEGEIYDYDIAPSTENSIKISVWKFQRFLKTTSDNSFSLTSSNDLLEYFNLFEKQGILKRFLPAYDLFEIKEELLFSCYIKQGE